MDKSLQLYSDANITKRPLNYISSLCVESKLTRLPLTSSVKKEWEKLKLVHSDLSGPIPVASYGISLYYLTRIDHATRVAWVPFMKQKSMTTKIIKDFVAEKEL